MPSELSINRVTLNTASYTSILARRFCRGVRISNEDRSSTITVRTDVDDATTAKAIPPGQTHAFVNSSGNFFEETEVVVSAIVDAGTGPAVCEFI